MDILNRNADLILAQLRIGEIPDTLDAGLHQTVRHFGGMRSRNTQNRNIRHLTRHKGLEVLHRMNRNAAVGIADDIRRHIKGTDRTDAAVGEIEVSQQCASQISRAEQNCPPAAGNTQNALEFDHQRLNAVTISLLSKAAEAAQILPDLRCGQTHAGRQILG